MDNWVADFEQNSSKPPAPPQPPRPPPRDVNPFGQPPTPVAAENGGGGGGSGSHGLFSSTEPPTPTSPPPPVPARNTTGTAAAAAAAAEAPAGAAGAAAAAPAAEVAVGNGSAGHDESLTPPPTSPPPPPLPPKSSPRSTSGSVVPGGEASAGAWGGGGGSASPATDARLTGRRKALDETRLFEERRSQHFGNKFESDSLYWKCFVELIRRSQANNRRAISYAMQKLKANHAYAMSLYAIRDNIDGLEAGTTSTRCEKERKERNRKGPREWPPPPDPADRVPTTPPPGKGGKGGPVPPPQPPSALDWLLVMEEDTAARTLDMCDLAAVNVVEKRLKGVVKALDDRFSEMVGKGTACLRLMHSAETNSTKAHARYQDVVTASIAREGDSSLGLRSALPPRDVTRSDVWLADMNYRVAVTQQARVWTGVSHKLADLFGKLKDIEVERRQAIQGGLMSLLQLQGALLRDLPVLREPAMQSLGRINLDRQLLDQEVRKEMREGATRMMADRQGDGSNGGGDGGGGGAATNGATGEAPPGSVEALGASQTVTPDFLRGLESPLGSSLIARSTMLERREKMLVTSRWSLVLAILTHDSYLLLFDVPKGGPAYKKQLNARTAEAFAELVPKPEVDAMAVELGKHKDGKGVDSGGLPVPPSVSIDLSACQVAFKPDGKSDATFEITEIKPARGVKGVFKDYEETKFTLRGRSQEAMVDWVCEIKEMGRAGLQALSGK